MCGVFVFGVALRAAGSGRPLLLLAAASDAAAGHDGVSLAPSPGQGCDPGRDLDHVSSGSAPEQKMSTEFTNEKDAFQYGVHTYLSGKIRSI